MNRAIGCIVFCSLVATAEDYIISLLPPQRGQPGGVSYLESHLEEVRSVLKVDYVMHSYQNMAAMDFFAYSITLQADQVEMLKLFDDINFIEPIGYMKVASFDSYVAQKYLRQEEPNLSHCGFCTVNYEMYMNCKDENGTYGGVDPLPAIVGGMTLSIL